MPDINCNKLFRELKKKTFLINAIYMFSKGVLQKFVNFSCRRTYYQPCLTFGQLIFAHLCQKFKAKQSLH